MSTAPLAGASCLGLDGGVVSSSDSSKITSSVKLASMLSVGTSSTIPTGSVVSSTMTVEVGSAGTAVLAAVALPSAKPRPKSDEEHDGGTDRDGDLQALLTVVATSCTNAREPARSLVSVRVRPRSPPGESRCLTSTVVPRGVWGKGRISALAPQAPRPLHCSTRGTHPLSPIATAQGVPHAAHSRPRPGNHQLARDRLRRDGPQALAGPDSASADLPARRLGRAGRRAHVAQPARSARGRRSPRQVRTTPTSSRSASPISARPPSSGTAPPASRS